MGGVCTPGFAAVQRRGGEKVYLLSTLISSSHTLTSYRDVAQHLAFIRSEP
jgi:hypothetical protein